MRNKIISIIISLSLAVSLFGCGGLPESQDPNGLSKLSKKELVTNYYKLMSDYNSQIQKYNDLNKMYQLGATSDQPTSAISSVGDGTNKLTFNSKNNSILFASPFEYPGSTPVPASGSINITQQVSLEPGNNWVSRINGSSLELEHSSGISGTVSVGRTTKNYTTDQIKEEVLAPWLKSNPVDGQVSYKDIFISKAAYGVQASTTTMIDSSVAFMRCGMLAFGGYSVVYVFVYRGAQDAVKDESEGALINSIKMTGQPIQVDM